MQRNIQIDFFRGLFLVIMTLDHLQYLPFSHIGRYTLDYTYQTFGFVATVEGFVFLSGLLIGTLYTPKLLSLSTTQFQRLVYGRVWHIYKYHLGAFACITLLFCIPAFNQAWPHIWDSFSPLQIDPATSFLHAMFLLYQPGLQDVLPMYIVFILITPWVLRNLEKGYAIPLILLSCVLWCIGQARPQTFLSQHFDVFFGWFEWSSWQLLFFAGVTLGYCRHKHPHFSIPVNPHAICLAITIVTLLTVYRHQFTWPFHNLPYERLFMDKNLGAVRILNAAALGYLLYAWVTVKPKWFTSNILVSLGQHSLLIFSYHVVLCYALTPLRPTINSFDITTQGALLILSVMTLWLPVAAKAYWHRFSQDLSRVPQFLYRLEKRIR